MDLQRALGLGGKPPTQQQLHLYINLKLAACGQPICLDDETALFMDAAQDMLDNFQEKNRQWGVGAHYPADRRIQAFLERYLADLDLPHMPVLPAVTLELDRHGVARELSLPLGQDEFHSEIVASYRVKQGVLHNPASDRRTTEGSFHIAEGGLPVPGDKKQVPKATFAKMLAAALNPPDELLTLPFSAGQPQPAKLFVSLLLRPIVCPAVPGVSAQKSMEIRFFAPGNLVSNLDFVESIFGNAGNPALPENDAGLDIEHWSGHSGCVILAPHLSKLRKIDLGLPHWDQASERQRTEGMCWQQPDELYNNGQAFKLTARDHSGVIVTLLADNYYGYCKKEVKTQISYAANLYGLAEEEHAGGALAFERTNHGEEFGISDRTREPGYSFAELLQRYGELMDVQSQGYAIDKLYPDIIYVPQDLRMNLRTQSISWQHNGETVSIRLQPGKVYVQPNGYKVEMCKHPGAPSWRLIGTKQEGTFCHKPCTVSGGGKSEISKSIEDSALYGPLFVDDFQKDLDQVQAIFDKDYRGRFIAGHEDEDRKPERALLSPERSLGSVIKLLMPSPYHNEAFKDWLRAIPKTVLAQVFLIKRFYRPEWGGHWRDHLAVDIVDGAPGHELKLDHRKIVATYLRAGFDQDGGWRTFKVRQDYIACEKVQMEDDITASVVVPAQSIAAYLPPLQQSQRSVKLVSNCEYRLFQRPDDAIHPGYDKQTEANMSAPGNFMANFEALDHAKLSAIVEDVLNFGKFTDPVKHLLDDAYHAGRGFVVSSAHPRLVNGKPSKNPRYLETRVDMIKPMRRYLADLGARLHRRIPLDQPVVHAVDAVLCGRRNNPPEPGIRALAVYNPIHYQELPELFMDFISSLTGKSPSTTGAGSEGALTKGPFNAVRATADLNNALVSFILTGYAGFSSSAGHIGPNLRVDHDISLLVPEIWSRLNAHERQPEYLIQHGFLEPVADFQYQGRTVLASRLGYRITNQFVHGLMGKIFDNPHAVFTDEILRPELQDLAVFADGVDNIVETQQRVALQYFQDGSIDEACPPLQALLHIMAYGQYQGKSAQHAEIRALFSREALLESEWYLRRLRCKQRREIALWQAHVDYLHGFIRDSIRNGRADNLAMQQRLTRAMAQLVRVSSPDYLHGLVGTLGADELGE
jgi:phosphoenolpyruvate carboxykinase (diphosphate)